MMQVGKLVKVYVYLKGKCIEVEPDEARALLAQLKAVMGEPAQVTTPAFIPVQPQVPHPPAVQPIPLPSPSWPQVPAGYPIITCAGQGSYS